VIGSSASVVGLVGQATGGKRGGRLKRMEGNSSNHQQINNTAAVVGGTCLMSNGGLGEWSL